MDQYGFLRVAAAMPHVYVADCRRNAERHIALAQQAAQRGVEIVVFPELSLTGYTCGDLFLQPTLLDAAEEALEQLLRGDAQAAADGHRGPARAPRRRGLQLRRGAGAGPHHGTGAEDAHPQLRRVLPEARWFASGAAVASDTARLCGCETDFGRDLTFEVNGAEFAIELCEDLWVAAPPSSHLAPAGARVVFNLSASPEAAGKHAYVRSLVAQQSARTMAAYVYCSAGAGRVVHRPGVRGQGLRGRERHDPARGGALFRRRTARDGRRGPRTPRRRTPPRTTTYGPADDAPDTTVIELEIPESLRPATLERPLAALPFVPDDAHRSERCEEILAIQCCGLARRLEHTACRKAVIGISGGLDSTLALLATVRTFDRLGLDRRGIVGITMPGFGTSTRTHGNAVELMRELGVTARAKYPSARRANSTSPTSGLTPRTARRPTRTPRPASGPRF